MKKNVDKHINSKLREQRNKLQRLTKSKINVLVVRRSVHKMQTIVLCKFCEHGFKRLHLTIMQYLKPQTWSWITAAQN